MNNQWNRRRAQSAMELAIFGAMMVFIIGMILKAGMGATTTMNQDLRAMRMAMRFAYESQEGEPKAVASHNSSGILLIEDRLWVEPGSKFLPTSRMPMLSQAQIVYGKNLFLPIDYGETKNLPIFEFVVNGQRFQLTSAKFMQYSLTKGSLPPCPPGSPLRQGKKTGQDYGYSTCWADYGTFTPGTCSITTTTACTGPLECPEGETCVGVIENGNCPIQPDGCAILHKTTGNFPNNDEWEVNDPATDIRFDLNLDGTYPDVARADQGKFNWQWITIYGVRRGTLGSGGEQLEGIETNPEAPKNTIVDVDGDFKEEGVKKIYVPDDTGRIETVSVIDYQNGDVNFSVDDRDKDLLGAGGMFFESKDMKMYSVDRSGTTYQVEEGRLFSPLDGQYVRQTNRQDHIDIIQRSIQLANNTNRLCDESNNPVGGSGVEACSQDCFTPANIQYTCMDLDDYKLYIRSRIEDLRQRRWVTRVAD